MTIEWKLEKRKLKELKEFDRNPRRISKAKFSKLLENLQNDGLIDKPVVNLDNSVIGGHQRLKALKKIGMTEVDVWVPDRQLDEKYIKGLNVRLNVKFGEYDDDILANEYEPEDLLDWGFTPEEIGGFNPEKIEKESSEEQEVQQIIKIEVNEEDYNGLLNQLEKLLIGFRAKII